MIGVAPVSCPPPFRLSALCSTKEHQIDPDYKNPLEPQEAWIRQLTTCVNRPQTQEQFMDMHMKEQMDAHLGDLFENAWPSCNSLTANTRIDQSIAMSAFDTAFNDRKETLASGTDREGNHRRTNGWLNLDNDADSEVEEDQHPSSYKPLNPFDARHNFFPYSDKSKQADKELMCHIQQNNKSIGTGINSIGHIVESSEYKLDQVLTMMNLLAKKVTKLKTTITSLQ